MALQKYRVKNDLKFMLFLYFLFSGFMSNEKKFHPLLFTGITQRKVRIFSYYNFRDREKRDPSQKSEGLFGLLLSSRSLQRDLP